MEDFPLQLALFGVADRIVEPFCYGCAGFVLSNQIARSVFTKLLFISLTILCFLWMDDIWPALANRSAEIAIASGNPTVAELFSESQQIGQAQFNSGGRSGLWDIYNLDLWDVGSAVVFVPFGFYAALALTRRRRDALGPPQYPPPPPGLNTSRPPPPPV